MNSEEPETSSFPAQHPAPQYHPPAPEPQRDRSGLAAVLLALLLVGAVALGVWMYNAFLRGDGEPAAQPPTPETTVVTVTPSSTPQRPTTTVTSTSPVETTETTQTTGETTPPPPAFRAPDHAVQCAANVNWRIFRASDRTSCGFAENVALAMGPHAGSDTTHELTVISPVTGQNYRMTCQAEGGNSYTCRGGDNAVVVLEDRGVRD